MGPILPFIIPEAFSNELIFSLMDLNGCVRYSVSKEINLKRMEISELKLLNFGIVILSNVSKNSWGTLRSGESNVTHLRKCTRTMMERTVNIARCGLGIGGGTFR
jgi:hypothetical protein